MGSVKDLWFYLAVFVGAIFVLQMVFIFFVHHPRKPALLASLCVVLFCFVEEGREQLITWTHGSSWFWLTRIRWFLPIAAALFLTFTGGCFTPREHW